MSAKKYVYNKGLTQSFSDVLSNAKAKITAAITAVIVIAGAVTPLAMTHAQGPNAGGGGGGTTTAGADLQMSGSASTNSPDPGSVYTYTFKIKNSGSLTAANVVFTNPTPSNVLPNYATLDGSTLPCVNQGNNTVGGSSAQCTIGALAKGSQAVVVVSVTAPQVAQAITNTATVTSDTTDPNTANNTVTINSSVKAPTGGVCKGGVCDTVPTAVAAPCAVLTNVSAPVGYYLTNAAIWNTFTVQSCSTSSEAVTVQVQETNNATGNVDYDITYPISLVPSQNMGVVLDNDFASYNTTYNITYTVRDMSGNVLNTASVTATTPGAL